MRSDRLKSPQLPLEFYLDKLLVIKNVKFTPRQIDIIACLISGGTGKTISSLLDIEVKTLEAHKKDIGGRIGGGIQEDIIAFVQKSDRYELLKQHYLILFYKSEFEKHLKELAKRSHEDSPILKIEPRQLYLNKSSFINLLLSHLRLAGIKIINDGKEIDIDKQELQSHTLSILTKTTIKQVQKNNSPEQTFFIILDKEISNNILKEMCGDGSSYIDFRDPKNYFSSCMEILKKIYPEGNLEKLASMLDAEDGYTVKGYGSNSGSSLLKEIILPTSLSLFQKQKKWFIGSGLILLSVIAISSLQFINKQEKLIQKDQPIRSELQLPVDEVLLKRPELMNQIDKKLMGNKGIQTVALVGPGGAGKTTFARHYAHSQNLPVVWEINAETKESLINSFKDLAYALAQTKEKKEELNFIQNIQNFEERERQIVSFVKRSLKDKGNWLLIYDNVETLSKVKDCFPQDPQVWGFGRIILTTRDNNIKNTSYIKAENVIHIEELKQLESLTLFSKILYNCDPTKLTKKQKQEVINFLQHIPPFPLDISAAAYYIKNSQITYEEYLKRIKTYSENFERDQETLINESSNYTKTRYGIITSSLEKIINMNSEFEELLLLICLIDSQNIPRELLIKYKNNSIVDNFIHNLKKYSLMLNDSCLVISLHRSTQQIIKNYLTRTLHLEKQSQLFNSMANTLAEFITNVMDQDDYDKMRLMVNHCERFLSYTFLTAKVKDVVAANLGAIYCQLGCYIKAQEILEEIRRSFNTYTEKPYRQLAQVLMYLGNAYIELGDPEKAKTVLEEGENIYKNHPPQKMHKIADILHFLGWAHKDLGKYNQAEAFLERSLNIYKEHYPHKHHKIALILSQIGINYLNLGEYKKARELLEQSLATYKEYNPENYRDIAQIVRDLGRVYGESGLYKEAKELFEENLEIYKKYHPEDHKDHIRSAWTLLHLGRVYRELGEYENAKVSLEKSITIYRKNYPEDPRIGWALRELGVLYKKLGQYNQAKEILEKSQIIFEEYYGHDHIQVGSVLQELGQTYFLKGDINTATSFLNKALSKFELNKHPESYIVFEILAELDLQKLRQVHEGKNQQQIDALRDQALNYLNKAYTIVTKKFPENSPHITRIQEKLKKIKY